MAYFKLEGENSQKIEVGDRLTIKSDNSGARKSCAYATVLEKGGFEEGAITTGSLPGTYMKINPNNISLVSDTYAVVDYGLRVRTVSEQRVSSSEFYPILSYPMSVGDLVTGDIYDFDVPAGSEVQVYIEMNRDGSSWDNCAQRNFTLNAVMRATADYADMFDFLIGENFQDVIDTGTTTCEGGCEILNVFIKEKDPSPPPVPALGTNYYYWISGNGTNTFSYLNMSGTGACPGSGKKRESSVRASFKINRADQTLVFETEPSDALPDVWFESSDTYDVASDTGYHQGSTDSAGQNQTASLPAIVTTDFFNCFSFGNGAESYKIRDSVVGKTFNLGNRIYTTSEKEYRESHRFSDLTYSGVYNEENNVNKLNEFNIGLLNYKPLEQSFGPVQKLMGRETDILVLQEDKISYVLQGKNLLSDAGAGSALTSVPEVLGTQIARIEDYGISNNPESFAVWGADKYFTDSKRGAVIQLKGTSARDEQLTVISNQGMRTWFRDLFIESFDTQKLGGFDPYMREYVLSSNDILLPSEASECVRCTTTLFDFTITETTPITFCVDVGDLVGDVTITYDIEAGSSEGDLIITYGDSSTTYNLDSSGIITYNKNSVGSTQMTIEVTAVALDPPLTLNSITVNCPITVQMTVIPVCFTSDSENGRYIHNEYSWTDGSYVSPTQSKLVEFKIDTVSNPVVSDYRTITSFQGGGTIPSNVATVQISANKFDFDDFVFDDSTDKFKYLRSSTLYANTDADMQSLFAAATLATPIVTTGAPDRYYAEFDMPASGGTYLYLIWDYRTSTVEDLCFGATALNACCGC
jgi:hypothetical protein